MELVKFQIEELRHELVSLEERLNQESLCFIDKITNSIVKDPALAFEDVSFAYTRQDGFVINSLSFAVPKGAGITALLGPSGVGKSTILRLIAGFERPNSGVIKINEEVVSGPNRFINPERRKVGFVFQDYALFPHLTVEKNIQFGLDSWGREKREERLREVLRFVSMEDYGQRMPNELSGGQQQRVALARALAPNPKILLMDEPFSNLDQAMKRDVRREVRDLINSKAIPTILVTHDIDDVTKMADRVIRLRAT